MKYLWRGESELLATLFVMVARNLTQLLALVSGNLWNKQKKENPF